MADRLILVLEDEEAIRSMVVFHLHRAGFQTVEAEDCAAAREALANNRVDLVLVDWMLPDMSGLEFTRSLKRSEETASLPIIMLTARATETDKVAGLESGADDYVVKPFSARELNARIDAVLRRVAETRPDVVSMAGLVVDPVSHRVTAGDIEITLGPTEYRLLKFLISHPERVYSRAQLLDQVWGANVYVEERTVDVHIRRLRKALEPSGLDKLIQTVRGAGYRMSGREKS